MFQHVSRPCLKQPLWRLFRSATHLVFPPLPGLPEEGTVVLWPCLFFPTPCGDLPATLEHIVAVSLVLTTMHHTCLLLPVKLRDSRCMKERKHCKTRATSQERATRTKVTLRGGNAMINVASRRDVYVCPNRKSLLKTGHDVV